MNRKIGNGNSNNRLVDPNGLLKDRLNHKLNHNNGYNPMANFSMPQNEEENIEYDEDGNPIEKEEPSLGDKINATKNQFESAAKDAVKNELKKQVKAKIVSFIKSNSYVLAIIGGIIVVVIILIILILGIQYQSDNNVSVEGAIGLYNYEYVSIDNLCENVTVVDTPGNLNDGTYPLEEYIAGVVKAEVGGFQNQTMYEIFSILARSFALSDFSNSGSCTIKGNTYKQAFKKINVTDAVDKSIVDAVNNSKGLVLTRDGKVITTMYDAFCWDKKDEDFYYICQKEYDTKADFKIPNEWVINNIPRLSGSAFVNNPHYQSHGQGLSTDGAYYLIIERNFSRDDVIKFFYGKDTIIKTIYQGVSQNFTQQTSSGLNDILNIPLKNFLSQNNTSVIEFNENILKNILNSGVGTRGAAVATALSLVGDLYEKYKIRLPYTLSGQHYNPIYSSSGVNLQHTPYTFYGIDPYWGSPAYDSNGNSFTYSGTIYSNYGPDCSGFVDWVLHNAGFNSRPLLASEQGQLGTTHELDGSEIAKPGDLIATNNGSHIMFIVGVDRNNKQYYIAHASGGLQGVKINPMSFNNPGNHSVDMTNWYENNKKNVSQEEFINLFREGYLE